MSPEQASKYSLAHQTYYPHYEQIVGDTLLVAQNISKLFQVFNAAFPDHQNSQKWITHPESLRDGKITCDMATVLIAVWWNMLHQLDSAIAVHDCKRDGLVPHCAIGLPQKPNNVQDIRESYFSQRMTDEVQLRQQVDILPVAWLHWLKSGSLQTVGKVNNVLTAPINVNIQVASPKGLARNRIQAHKLPKTAEISKLATASAS